MNIKGEKFEKHNPNYHGEEGIWIEKQMGLKPNSKNEPDILGYEMKKKSNVITFIDKQTDEKFLEGKAINKRNKLKKEKWWKLFERTNSKDCRVGGWKLNIWDNNGQCLQTDNDNNINIAYSWEQDKREDKEEKMSDYYKNKKEHVIGTWRKDTLKKCIERKFNNKGWITFKKDKENRYEKICFGSPIDFDKWISSFKKREVYYDGYSRLNGRWRGTFRAKKDWWNKQITSEY